MHYAKLNAQCGEIREIKITNMPETLVATVEFAARVRDWGASGATTLYVHRKASPAHLQKTRNV